MNAESLFLLLANLPEPEPGGLERWVIGLGAFLVLINLLKTTVDKFLPKKPVPTVINEQPLIVQMQDEFVPRREFSERLQRIDKDLGELQVQERRGQGEIKQLIRDLGNKMEDRDKEIFHRLTEAEQSIGFLRGRESQRSNSEQKHHGQ